MVADSIPKIQSSNSSVSEVDAAFDNKLTNVDAQFQTSQDFDTKFNIFIGAVVFSNAAVIALETDRVGAVDPASISEGEKTAWTIVNNTFAVIFCLELCFRIYRERWAYPKSAWNWLDVVCVSTTSLDLWILPLISDTGDLPSLSVLRVLRLVRLMRLLRIFRMFEDMYVLIVAFVMSLHSMAWVTVLIVLGIFLAAIFLTQLVGQEEAYRDLEFDRGSTDDLFGSVSKSMYTLFELMTMENWNGIGRPLVMKDSLWVLFFICFFMLFSFGLLNMVVGLVVEKTIHQSRNSKKKQEKSKRVEAKAAINDLKAIYLELDGNGDGVLTLEEMAKSIENPSVKKSLERMGVPVDHITDLFEILDVDGSCTVDVHEFIEGMTKIKGKFRNRDFVAAEVSIKIIERVQRQILEKIGVVRQNEAEIHQVISRVEDKLTRHRTHHNKESIPTNDHLSNGGTTSAVGVNGCDA